MGQVEQQACLSKLVVVLLLIQTCMPNPHGFYHTLELHPSKPTPVKTGKSIHGYMWHFLLPVHHHDHSPQLNHSPLIPTFAISQPLQMAMMILPIYHITALQISSILPNPTYCQTIGKPVSFTRWHPVQGLNADADTSWPNFNTKHLSQIHLLCRLRYVAQLENSM